MRLNGLTHIFLVILSFLDIVRHSMSASRREIPTPQDFIAALTAYNISPSSLLPHTRIPPAPSIAQPALTIPPPSETNQLDPNVLFSGTLSSDIAGRRRKYVASHLPGLPSKHTWQVTPVLPTREQDALKIRERATQEGVMAEQALRRLMAASSKAGEERAAVGRKSITSGRAKSALEKALETARELEAAEELKDDAGAEFDMDDMDIDFPVIARRQKTVSDTSFESGLAVNYDRRYWRASGRGKA
jgi:transcription initiation factor TFIID subunit 8